MANCVGYAKSKLFAEVNLEVNKHNHVAISLYHKQEFVVTEESADDMIKMKKQL